MNFKKILIAIFLCSIVLCGGCGKNDTNRESVSFLSTEVNECMPSLVCRIKDLNQSLYLYFPVVTNKKITETELGCVGAKSYMQNSFKKITIKPEVQDKLNESYNGYYISFLKYRVVFDDVNIFKNNDCIQLCDTKLWIYHETEFVSIEFNNDYLKIVFIEDENDICLPNWEISIDNMKNTIKAKLNGLVEFKN